MHGQCSETERTGGVKNSIFPLQRRICVCSNGRYEQGVAYARRSYTHTLLLLLFDLPLYCSARFAKPKAVPLCSITTCTFPIYHESTKHRGVYANGEKYLILNGTSTFWSPAFSDPTGNLLYSDFVGNVTRSLNVFRYRK